jgi:hypothetical protein
MAIDAHEAHPGPKEAMMQDNVTEHPGGESRHGYPVGHVWGPACNYPPGSNTCLTITYLAYNDYSVHVGIDVHMSRYDAQLLINATNGSPLIAYLMGDDGQGPLNPKLFRIPQTWTAAGDGGLSAEFDARVDALHLNEDPNGDGRDELYALVVLDAPPYIPDIPERHFTSGVITAIF